MINRLAFSRAQSLSGVLRYTDIRSYVFTAVFVSLAVATPWVFHQFQLAGATFLPMHIFILVAGLLFGWRAGLIVGLSTPLVSYAISGMPVIAVLPQMVMELSAYGLVAGVLRERFNLRAVWALVGAMIGGRVALLLVVAVIQLVSQKAYSPLGPETNALTAVWSTMRLGWPGIIVQLAFVPLTVKLLEKYLGKDRTAVR